MNAKYALSTTPSFRQLIGARLARVRRTHDWSTADVGQLIGMSAKSVENHEHGRCAIPVDKYLRIYGMTARVLLAEAATIRLP